MKIARISYQDSPCFAVYEPTEHAYHLISGHPLVDGVTPTGEILREDEVRLLSPIIPGSKVIGIGSNYASAEISRDPHVDPPFFFKPNTSVIGPGDPIVLPEWAEKVVFEAELAVVIGRMGTNVPAERAGELIFGYTCANDLSVADDIPNRMTAGKGFDTACPLGPWIETDLDTSNLAVRARLNGELKQDGSTSAFINSPAEVVAFCSRMCTLLPGDVILTATPLGSVVLSHGDEIEVDVENIGVLSNPVLRH